MIAFEAQVRIDRPIDDVFSYVSDPLNFPHWNAAVKTVLAIDPNEDGSASTYRMEREVPTGHAVNKLEILARERPRGFTIRTTAGPTPIRYRYWFSATDRATVVELDAEVELPRPAAFAPRLAGRAVKSGVEHNFAMLKAILESAPFPHARA